MQTDWQDFLATQGARFDGATVRDFGDARKERAALAHETVLADLSTLAYIRVDGADATTFLQAPLTRDVRDLGGRHALAGWCNAQGRLMALFRVFPRQGGLTLALPADLAAPVLARLRMFVLRSKVTLTLADDLGGLGLAGPGIEPLLARAALGLPAGGGALDEDGLTVLRLPTSLPRVQLIGAHAALKTLWPRLAVAALPVGTCGFTWLDVRDGLPQVYRQTQGAFIPQMLNLERLDAISFDKGCYPGQEIVARTHYLGRLKQRMHRLAGTLPCAPGDGLVAASLGDAGRGTVVDAAPSPDGGFELLAVVPTAAIEAGDVRLKAGGERLRPLGLPYSSPPEVAS